MRILVIGAGSVGQRHIRNLRTLRPGVTVVTVDPDVPADYRDYGTALEAGRYDAAIIASPTDWHMGHMMGLSLPEWRVSFLVEKPLSARDYTPSTAVSMAAGLRCAVGFQWRYHPVVTAMREMWERNRLLKFTASQNMIVKYGLTCLETIGSHVIDLALWVLGPALEVDMTTDGRTASGTITHEHGESNYQLDMTKDPRISYVVSGADAVSLPPDNQMYVDELADFLTYVETGIRPARLATLADGLAVQGVMNQCKTVS